jgi:hypothetical protein
MFDAHMQGLVVSIAIVLSFTFFVGLMALIAVGAWRLVHPIRLSDLEDDPDNEASSRPRVHRCPVTSAGAYESWAPGYVALALVAGMVVICLPFLPRVIGG